MSDATPKGPTCPDADLLRKHLTGKSSENEAIALREHVEKCPVCRQAMNRIAAESPRAAAFDSTFQGTPPAPAEMPPAEKPSSASASIPGYEVIAAVGRGGMGVVYKARHLRLDRIVALKMLLSGDHAGIKERARFLNETEAVAQLQHPNIVPLFEAGQHGELPYFTMEFASAGSLADLLRGTPLPPLAAARLVEQLANAVQHAHEHGIIHRDLKPGNVLLQPAGAWPLDEASQPSTADKLQATIPKITDFGLAKNTADNTALTSTGAVFGTPSYMAPEQASGDIQQIGAAADIYALGAILYECLTGRPPFKGPTAVDTILLVLSDDPVPISRLQRTIPRDLETICLKCLHKIPHQRYGSARALADDLRRFQMGEPILARPVGTIERAVMWGRRRPAVAALLAALFVLAVVGSGAVVWQWRQATTALADLQTEKKARAQRQVAALPDATPGRVPAILEELEANREEILPLLRQRYEQENDRGRRMRLALALLPVDAASMREPLMEWMLAAEEPDEVLLVRESLASHRADLNMDRLWAAAESTRTEAEPRRLRAAAALAKYDPKNDKWEEIRGGVVNDLVTSPAVHLGAWIEGFHAVREQLDAPLSAVFRDAGRRSSERSLATDILVRYVGDQPSRLADLLMDADDKQFAVIYPKLRDRGEHAIAHLNAELGKSPVLPKGKLIFEHQGEIAKGDPVFKDPSISFPAKQFEVKLEAGKAYRMSMVSKEIDSIIVVQEKGGMVLTADDDGGGGLNSLLEFVPSRDGFYVIFAGSIDKTGAFDLSIREKPTGEDPRDTLAKRQANAGVALLKLGRADAVWHLLKHSSDPRGRSYLIHRLGLLGADSAVLAKRLDSESDLGIKRALMLSLDEAVPASEAQQSLVPQIQSIYRTAADPGLHAAAEWLLRRWKQDAWLRTTNKEWASDPQQHEKVERIRKQTAKDASPQWYVDKQGHTMVVVPGPAEFTMGAPATEEGRSLVSAAELQRKKRIGRTFALSATPVTKEQFMRVFPKLPIEIQNGIKYFPEPECALGGITWYEAAAYCNWLSKQEGIPEDEWCYEQDAEGKVTKLKEGYLRRTGYRLPTEPEFEYASRAGAITSRYFGESEELLGHYAWYRATSKDRTWPVGLKKPNDFGLFDMHGNVATWCQGALFTTKDDVALNDIEGPLDVAPTKTRMVRGGAFSANASIVRSAYRVDFLPLGRTHDVGIRPARTLIAE